MRARRERAGAAGSATGPDEDPNRRFLASVSSAGVEVAKATKNNRIDALVAQGTMIRGVLETALQSDLPGMVRAITTEDVWSFDGRRIGRMDSLISKITISAGYGFRMAIVVRSATSISCPRAVVSRH